MRTIPFGTTGESVSCLCLGAMHMGSSVPEKTSRAILDCYVEAGGRFIDTANSYTRWSPGGGNGGDSEYLIGRWMKDRGNRDEIFLATKVGIDYPDEPGKPESGQAWGTSPEQIQVECEKSLQRLGVDVIDLYYVHQDDRETPIEESLKAMNGLIEQGKVRHIACSNYVAWRIAEARLTAELQGLIPYCCVQYRVNYLRQNAPGSHSGQLLADRNLYDYCRTHRFPIVGFSPLMKGGFTRQDRVWGHVKGVDTDLRMQALRQVAAKHDATVNQVALGWFLEHDPVVIPLFSGSRLEQVEESLGALDVTLDGDDLKTLREAGNIYR